MTTTIDTIVAEMGRFIASYADNPMESAAVGKIAHWRASLAALPTPGDFSDDVRWLLALIDDNDGRHIYTLTAQHVMAEIEQRLAAAPLAAAQGEE